MNNVKIIIGCMYRPLGADYDQFAEALEEILASVSWIQAAEIFISGDYNLECGK